MSQMQSGSCIKVNGVPLLPPIITNEMREYIKKVRQEAILIEKRLAERRKEKKCTFVNKWTEVDQLLGLFSCGLEHSDWTGASTREFNLVSSSTQTIIDEMDYDINNVPEEQILKEKNLSEGRKAKKRTFVNKWTEIDQLLGLFSCGLEHTDWTGASTREFNLVSSSTQTIDWTENLEEYEQLPLGKDNVSVTGFNAWTQMSKYFMGSMKEPKERLISNSTSDITSSVQIELDKRQTLEMIRQRCPLKKGKSVVPMSPIWNRGCTSKKDKEKWTSCPNNLGSSCSVQNDVTKDLNEPKITESSPKELNQHKTTDSSREKWKRWRSLPDMYGIKPQSVGSSQNSEEYIQNIPLQGMTDTTSKLEISPERQKSYTLGQPSKDLLDYVRKGAYGSCTSNLSNRQKSYSVIEPSKFLLEYVKTKGRVGPVEENIPQKSRISHSEIQRPVHCSRPTSTVCPKCKEVICVCNEDDAETFMEKELKNRAATVINAAARGYFVRRLMRTRRVQQCVDTIRYTIQCHLALSSKSKEDSDDRNVELHLCIMRELLKSCEEFYDTFFNISKSEQLKIIASDRLSRFER